MNTIENNQILSSPCDIAQTYYTYPMSVIYMNIRSLRLNFSNFLATIGKIIQDIKIIVLVETNITNDENSLYTIDGFNSTFFNRDGRGGGIAVYVKDGIKFDQIVTRTHSFELIQLNLHIGNKEICLFALYRPPHLNVREFITELDTMVNNLKKKQDILIIGDMNLDIKKENITATTYLTMALSNGLKSMINEYTRENIEKDTKSCIDHVLLKVTNAITHTYAAVITTTISDHYSIFFCIKYDMRKQCKETIKNDLPRVNNYTVNKKIQEVNWTMTACEETNTNTLYNNIVEKLSEIYRNSKKETKTSQKRSPTPWINEKLIHLCDIRDNLYKRWKNNKRNKKYEYDYKRFRNSVNKKIKSAKNEYYRNKFIEYKHDMRATWGLINEIIGKKTYNIDENILKNFKGHNLNTILHNFSTKFNDNVNKIIHICNIKTINILEPTQPNSMFFAQITEDEINSILMNLNTKKSPGVDGIRPQDLKNNAKILTPVITKLINSSLNEAIVPNLLKTSIIRPIHKSGSKSDYSNYRPIAILPVIEKVLEEVIVRRLTDYLKKFNIINKNQFGFQKQKNINKLLGNFSTQINNYLSQHMHCLVLYIDFSKAFDTLSHPRIIQLLENIGIRGNTLMWFKNYLQCRTYRVKVSNKLSSAMPAEFGVPQGSKLGPILYIIYANEMLRILRNCTTFAYADDTAIVVADKNIETALTVMQNQFDTATKWCHDNGLIINASKTKIMHIKPPHFNDNNIAITFHDTQCLHNPNKSTDACTTIIEQVTVYKYLGVLVDSNFKWNMHVDELQKKLRKTAYALFHLGTCATYTVLRQAYFSLSESYIRHGIAAWGSASHCRALQITQNRLLKILSKNKQLATNKSIYTQSHINTNNNNANETNPNTSTINAQTLNTYTNHTNTINISVPMNLNTLTNDEYARDNHSCFIDSNLNINNLQNNDVSRRTRLNITSNISLAKDLNILNIKNIYYTTLANEFYNDARFLHQIDHAHDTRRRAEGRFIEGRFYNEYGRKTLEVTLPKIFNSIPINIVNIKNKHRRNKLIKDYLVNLQ